MSPLFFHNTLTRKVEEFVPLSPPEVKLYTCGPTVYDYAHIGNFRSYVFEDLLRRLLKYRGFKVTQVMNITDIDDKIIRASRKEGIPFREFTGRYSSAFFEDIRHLNVEAAEHYPRATDHIPEMTAIIESLLTKGIAYRGDDGSTYFSIGQFEGYGSLSRISREDLKVGVRVKLDEYEKETASDFALWKAWDEDDGDVFWDTPLGRGRPGWHIECSAMSMKYLGEQFDIHTGGVDNIFPHHENEIAQSEAASGVKFVNYWLHCEHLLVNHRKMSKSLGNFYTLRDLMKQGYSPLALRYLYISTHYRSKLNFTLEALGAAQNTVKGIVEFLDRLSFLPEVSSKAKDIDSAMEGCRKEFLEAISEDLDTPRALPALFDLIRQMNIHINNSALGLSDGMRIQELFFDLDRILGLDLEARVKKAIPRGKISGPVGREAQPDLPSTAATMEPGGIADEDRALIAERELARKNRDFKRADEIRNILAQKGIGLLDTPSGTVWKKE